MTHHQISVLNIARIVGPFITFCVVVFVLGYFTKTPLVLAVVLACLLAIIEFVLLTWFIRRQSGGA